MVPGTIRPVKPSFEFGRKSGDQFLAGGFNILMVHLQHIGLFTEQFTCLASYPSQQCYFLYVLSSNRHNSLDCWISGEQRIDCFSPHTPARIPSKWQIQTCSTVASNAESERQNQAFQSCQSSYLCRAFELFHSEFLTLSCHGAH